MRGKEYTKTGKRFLRRSRSYLPQLHGRAAQGLPLPEFESKPECFAVTFSQSPYTENRLRALGLSERQMRVFRAARKPGGIGNATVQELIGVSKRTALRELKALEDMGLLRRTTQTGRNTR